VTRSIPTAQARVDALMVALRGVRSEVSATAAAANREREAACDALHAAQQVQSLE